MKDVTNTTNTTNEVNEDNVLVLTNIAPPVRNIFTAILKAVIYLIGAAIFAVMVNPILNFIKVRRNKDNFWNLMFASGLFLGVILSLVFSQPTSLPFRSTGIIFLLLTFIGVPLIVKHFAKVTYIDNKFFTIEGRQLDIPRQIPTGFFVVITTIGVMVLVAFKSGDLPPLIKDTIWLFLLFFIPILFFICKNCPITILFNYQLWKQNVRFSYNYEPPRSSVPLTTPIHWTLDPRNAGMSGNVFHHKYNGRF